MARLIGEAYIVVYPDTDQFATQLETKLETATKALKPDVNVTPTLDKTAAGKLKTALNALAANVKITPELDQARLGTIKTALDAALGDYRVDVKANLSAAQVAALKKLLDTELNGGGGTKVNLNTAGASEELQGLIDRSVEVKDQLEDLRANIDDTQAESALVKLLVQTEALQKGLAAAAKSGSDDLLPLESTVLSIEAGLERINAQKLDLDTVTANTNLIALADRAGELRITLSNYRANVNSDQAIAKLSALEVEAAKLSRAITFAPNDADLAPFQAALDSIVSKYSTLQAIQKKEDDELNKQAGLWGSLGLAGPGSLIHITDILNASLPEVKLFDGAVGNLYKTLSGNELPTFVAHLTNVATSAHLTAEAAIEFVAIWGPALLGLTAFAVAAAPALYDIGTQLKNMEIVAHGTGVEFQNLNTQQSKIAQSVKPQVMQLFGDYLLAAGQNGDHLAKVLDAIGTVLDNFGTAIVQALQSNGTSKFLDKAASDINGLGVAFTQVGRVIADLLQDVPGYAEILLKLGDAALTAGADIIGFINPVIAKFLLLHGAVFYIGLASTALIQFGKAAVPAFTAVAAGADKLDASGSIFSRFGTAIGNAAGAIANFVTSSVKFVTQTIAMSGELGIVGAAVEAFKTAFLGLAETEAAVTAVEALRGALEGLKDTEEVAGAVTALNTAIEGMKDVEGTAAAVTVLNEAIKGLEGAESAAAAVTALDVAIGTLEAEEAGGALAGIFAALAGPLGVFLAIAAPAAAIIGVGLYVAMHQAASAADQLHTSLQKLIDSSNVITLQSNIASAAKQTSALLDQQTTAVTKLIAANKTSGDQVVNFHTGDYTAFGKQLETLNSQIATNKANLQTYADENAVAATRIQGLTSQYGSLSDASELLSLAGVKQTDIAQAQGDAWAKDLVKIQATAEAYGLMGQQAGAAGNQLDTLTISGGQVTKSVQSLVSAEQQWLTLITGGDSAFTTFEQGLATLSDTITGKMTPATITSTTATDKATQSVSKLSGSSDTARKTVDQLGGTSTTTGQSLTKLAGGGTDATTSLSKTAKGGQDVATSLSKTAKSTTDYINALTTGTSTTTKAAASADTLTVHIGNLKEVFSTAGAAMNGTSAASLAVRQAFDQQITSAGTLFGNLQQLAAASGNSTTANKELAKSGQDIVAQLLPLAAGSKEATSEVYALAQIVGYTGPNDFAKMAQWVGRVKDAEGDLDTQQSALTTSSATLSTAAKNLSGALQDEVTQIQSKGILATTDFTTVQNNLITSLQNTGGAMTELSDQDAKAYYAALVKAGVGTDTARQYTDALLQRLGVLPPSINDVNKELDAMTKANQGADGATATLNAAQATLTATMATAVSSGLIPTQSAMDTLSTAIQTNSGNVDNNRTAFDKLASQLGISKGATDQLWTSLKNVTGTYGATVNVKLAGGGTIQASVTAEAALVAASQQAAVASAAAAQSPHIIPLGAVGGIMTSSGFAGRELFAGGGTVRGSGPAGKDSVHAMLAPGELVIPTTHVAAHAAQARREGIPGMAAGGVVDPGSFTGSPFVTNALAKYSEPGYATAVMNVVSTQAREATLKATVEAMKEVLAAVAAQGTPGNVQSYKGIVDTVLGLLGQPVSDDTIVLAQMATESGGNPTAVNNSDSNAVAGTPSTGLMQVIGPTFAAYAGPFANTGPFVNGVSVNPEANIYAGLNYAIHRYGSQWTSVLGQGHGYSAGGMVNEPVFGVGKHTGTPYSFAERGPEYVGPISGAPQGNSGGGISDYQFQQLIQEVRNLNQTTSQQGRNYARTLNGSAAQGVRRGYFATSG